jgi:hypothetical protein
VLAALKRTNRNVQFEVRERECREALEPAADRAVLLRRSFVDEPRLRFAVVDDFVLQLVARDALLLLGREVDACIESEDDAL